MSGAQPAILSRLERRRVGLGAAARGRRRAPCRASSGCTATSCTTNDAMPGCAPVELVDRLPHLGERDLLRGAVEHRRGVAGNRVVGVVSRTAAAAAREQRDARREQASGRRLVGRGASRGVHSASRRFAAHAPRDRPAHCPCAIAGDRVPGSAHVVRCSGTAGCPATVVIEIVLPVPPFCWNWMFPPTVAGPQPPMCHGERRAARWICRLPLTLAVADHVRAGAQRVAGAGRVPAACRLPVTVDADEPDAARPVCMLEVPVHRHVDEVAPVALRRRSGCP